MWGCPCFSKRRKGWCIHGLVDCEAWDAPHGSRGGCVHSAPVVGTAPPSTEEVNNQSFIQLVLHPTLDYKN